MKTKLTSSSQRRSVPVRRFNILPLLAILAFVAVGAVLMLLFPMEWVHAPGVTVSTKHSSISPNADGNLDTAPVIYSLSTSAVVTVDVLDSTRSTVRTLIEQKDQAAGQHTVIWEGLDRLGQALPNGEYFVRITAQGTARSSASTVRMDVDTKPPVIRMANLPEDTQVGGEKRELLVEGVTDPDATVWLNDRPQPLEVSDSGGFSILYTLQEGVNEIELIAVDEAGNQTSIVREITLLTQPPDILVTNPSDNLWINQQMLSVQGSVSPGTQVRVNQTEATVDEEGNFNVDVVLEEGENNVRIEAGDDVGNISVEERRVYLRTRPPALSLTTVNEGMTVREPSILAVGQTEPHTTVWLNGRELEVDSQGGFQGMVDLVEGDNVIRVEALDRAGNTAVLVREVTYASEVAETGVPSAVRGVLAATGAGLVGVVGLWLISGLWQNPLSLVLRTSRPTLSPGGSDRLEPAVVVFELSRPATVTAEVWDQANHRVATLFHRQRRDKGEHLLVWDGRGAEGWIASPGSYEVEVSASNLFTTVSSSTNLWVEEVPSRPVRDEVRQRGQRVRQE